jgi:hypothetical protein
LTKDERAQFESHRAHGGVWKAGQAHG